MSNTQQIRVAMVSVHTSPLARPGDGDAGGMNVYALETAKRLARRGTRVDTFTRRTTAAEPPVVDVEPGVRVRYIDAGPYEGLAKEDLPGQLCAFAAGMMRIAAQAPEGYYDVVHSHYWLSGQVGWLAADRWDVPLVHTMHTMARVKNRHLASGDIAEPMGREIGEAQVIEAADRLIANTDREAAELIELYDADPARVDVIAPGVDLQSFTPGDRYAARAAVGVPQNAVLILFAGRLQPLKGPDTTIRAAAELIRARPELRDRLIVAILGGASGSGTLNPRWLADIAVQEGISDRIRFQPPTDRETLAQWMRAADVVTVPSHNESFGLIALEAQACGAIVVATRVGGLPTAVGDAGILIDGHDPTAWANAIDSVITDKQFSEELSLRAAAHANQFGWERTSGELTQVYRHAIAAPRRASINAAAAVTGIPSAVVP